MGNRKSRPSVGTDVYPAELEEAFRHRFIGKEFVRDEDAYVSFYILAYEFAFFLRNDPSQTVIEEDIRKRQGSIDPQPSDWLLYCIRFLNHLIKGGDLVRYGHRYCPIILGLRRRYASTASEPAS